MKILTATLLLSASVLSATAFAEPEVIYTQNSTPQTATHRLLEAQRSGQNASTEEQYLSGKVNTQIYERYVKSFSRPIPERFSSDTFTEE
ncbi:DUF3613 domain-containing protein [Zhongshania sp.]|jgi:hypothetical protein|uniref:DUF3613 domain-containing protein n=1 Tax=Zhongshania sp. TaxID=1971902 RepID=UPI0039E51DF7